MKASNLATMRQWYPAFTPVRPTSIEYGAARAALDDACRDLGLPAMRLRFYVHNLKDSGLFLPRTPRTVYLASGLPLRDIARRVRHECGHACQNAAGLEVGGKAGHDGYGRREQYRSTVERYALGDRKARKTLRGHVRRATSAAVVADVQTFLETQKGTPA